jgi:cytochrome c oxidase assembly factor CtaG
MLTIAIVLAGCVYLRGWFAIRKTRAPQFTLLRLSWYLLGLVVIWVAIASPLDKLADALLSAHMVQHLLLMSVVPPLLLLGWPVVPLLRGLPAWILRPVLGPVLRLGVLRRVGRCLISPLIAWVAMNLTFLGWHVPAGYNFALQPEISARLRACLFSRKLIGILVVRNPALADPAPREPLGPVVVPAFGGPCEHCSIGLSLAFCGWPVYSYYLTRPNSFHVSPLSDEVLGAVIMWVVGSSVFLVPATWITFSLLQRPSPQTA